MHLGTQTAQVKECGRKQQTHTAAARSMPHTSARRMRYNRTCNMT